MKPKLERKQLTAYGVKVLDDAQGIVEATVAGIGNVDEGGDIIEPGFFADSLKVRNPKGVWSHDWATPIAKALEISELAPGDTRLPDKMKAAGVGGYFVKTQFNLDTQRGREAFSDVVFFGDEQEWSIGYTIDLPGGSKRDDDGNRHLIKGQWYEFSPVLFGMNTLTGTGAVKAALSEKVIPGSLEAQQRELLDALEGAEQRWCWIVATFADSIVYMASEELGEGGYRDVSFRRTYSRSADGSVSFGDPEPVSVVEMVMPRDDSKVAKADPKPEAKPDEKWKVSERDGQFVVVKVDDDAVLGTYPITEQAEAHVAQLVVTEKAIDQIGEILGTLDRPTAVLVGKSLGARLAELESPPVKPTLEVGGKVAMDPRDLLNYQRLHALAP